MRSVRHRPPQSQPHKPTPWKDVIATLIATAALAVSGLSLYFSLPRPGFDAGLFIIDVSSGEDASASALVINDGTKPITLLACKLVLRVKDAKGVTERQLGELKPQPETISLPSVIEPGKMMVLRGSFSIKDVQASSIRESSRHPIADYSVPVNIDATVFDHAGHTQFARLIGINFGVKAGKVVVVDYPTGFSVRFSR